MGADQSASPLPCTLEQRLSDYSFYCRIGSGGFSTVYLVRSNKNQKFYALKAIEKSKVSTEKSVI